MSVNGITGANDVYGTYSSASQTRNAAAKAENTGEAKATESAGVVYEPSNNKTASTKSYKPNTNVVAQMKADAEARTAQLQSLVQKMLTKQGETYNTANGIWGLLAQGKVKADPATIAQAKADIAEDGYWGVKQTSQRILDFATALTGGDPSKIEKMRSAFQKGYDKAQKTWGGQLPAISQQTYDAVLSGFDKMAQEAGIQS
ncbi:MAG: hypothetical protein K2P13_10620 [Lachnospiraceae bacterium]|mgnify:FL=1|nr:hypothetical protein [Lachnospiraceae bacterium]MDE6977426.1 hypothetical protein [Lachnospiraceae bacterium]